ncbi:MAG: transcription termination factor NusA [Chloroflexota bacterium]
MKEEFALAFNEVLDEKQLPREVIIEALEAAMISAYRKTVNASSAQEIRANFDLDTGNVTIFAEKEAVESVQDERTEVLIEEAVAVEPEAELGSIVIVESTPQDFGRVAAQTARQVIQQRIREAEREVQHDFYHNMIGEVVNGVVQAMNPHAITVGLDRKAEGSMPRNHQIPGERFRLHDRVRALLLDVKQTPRGPQIILSRGHRNFLRRLLEDEVPEIYHGLVEIRSIAREPGYRSKVAVGALQPGIDPVGACVGVRGVRIQAIVRELNDEKIDVIDWNPDPAAFIAKALSPARVSGVHLNETIEGIKTATVIVPEDQLSLAIGRDGQNARLAAKLTSWRIDIKSLTEAAADSLVKLAKNPEYAEEKVALADIVPDIEVILVLKAEGRPLTPEKYQLLARFVNQVESGAIARKQEELAVERARIEDIKAAIPPVAFDIILDDLGLAPTLNINITGEGFTTIGDLMLQLALNQDVILSINGIGPKTLEAIEAKIESFEFPEIEVIQEEPEAELDEGVAAEVKPQADSELEVEGEVTPQELLEVEAEKGVEVESKKAQPAAAKKTEDDQPASIDEVFAKSMKKLGVREESKVPKKVAIVEEPTKSKQKKKKKFREIEYDPDHDVTIVRNKHKRDQDGWDEEEY